MAAMNDPTEPGSTSGGPDGTPAGPDVQDTVPVRAEPALPGSIRPGPTRPRHAGPPAHRGDPLPPPDAGYRYARPEPPPPGTVDDGWPAAQPADPCPATRPADPRRGGPGTRVPPWLLGVATLALVAMVAVLGFGTPGFFVTTVFDQAAVQNGVRSVLINDYRLSNVRAVVCPAGQQVLPARDFVCVAQVDNSPAQVRVVIQDRAGHYRVSRPN